MTNAVYVGGFGEGRGTTEKVGDALYEHYNQVEVFTFSDLERYKKQVKVATAGAELWMRSSGAKAIVDTGYNASKAYFINCPYPRSIPDLLARTVLKTISLSIPGNAIKSKQDALSVADYSATSLVEMLGHPIANFAQLKAVSELDTFALAQEANDREIDTTLVWTAHDLYFPITANERNRARAYGITNAIIMPGEHDQMVVEPSTFIAEVLRQESHMGVMASARS